MGVTVLGQVAVNGTARLSPRDRVVLEAWRRAPEAVTADQLRRVWGDPSGVAGKILQGCIVRLRKPLGPEAIVTTPRATR